MGILNSLLGQLTGSASSNGPEAHASLLGAIEDLLGQSGGQGLASLLSSFEQQGLGAVMQSWISNGPNQAISPEQLLNVLGPERVQAMSQKLGMDVPETAGQLARLLPMVVDQMTPQGALPAKGTLDGLLGIFQNRAS